MNFMYHCRKVFFLWLSVYFICAVMSYDKYVNKRDDEFLADFICRDETDKPDYGDLYKPPFTFEVLKIVAIAAGVLTLLGFLLSSCGFIGKIRYERHKKAKEEANKGKTYSDGSMYTEATTVGSTMGTVNSQAFPPLPPDPVPLPQDQSPIPQDPLPAGSQSPTPTA